MPNQLPETVLQSTEKAIKELYTGLDSVSIVLSRPSQTQLAFTILEGMANFLENHPYTELSLFSIQHELPVMVPHCAIYPANKIPEHIGPIVATDPNSYMAMKLANDATKYYYLYDINLLHFIPVTEVAALRQSGIKLFTRTDDHRKYVKDKFNLETLPTLVPNAELELIYSIVKG